MSAIEVAINNLTLKSLQNDARAELAQLRDDSLLLIGSNRLLSEIGALLNCAPDSTILDRISGLHATIAEQARQLKEAHKVLHDFESPEDTIAFAMRELACIIPADEMIWNTWLLRQADVIDTWLAAHPAPQEQKP